MKHRSWYFRSPSYSQVFLEIHNFIALEIYKGPTNPYMHFELYKIPEKYQLVRHIQLNIYKGPTNTSMYFELYKILEKGTHSG